MKKSRDYSWFNLADYEPQRQFGLREWALMLFCRQQFQDDAARFRIDTETDEVIEAYWRKYLDEALPCNYQRNKSTELCASVPVIRDVTNSLRHGRHDFIHGFGIEMFPVRILQLNILAPDATLIKAFRSWLCEVRKSSPLPIRRRGRQPLPIDCSGEISRMN
jgi:hypothetical protein